MTRRHYFLIALIPFLLLATVHYLSPSRQLKASQNQLLEAISNKDEAKLMKLVDPDYTDQWSFTAADWPAILKDLRMLSPVLEIVAVNPVPDVDNGVVDTALQAKSAGGPVADSIAAQGVALKEPTRFVWKRRSWTPWSWRLVSIQNPAVEIPSSYRPGKYGSMEF